MVPCISMTTFTWTFETPTLHTPETWYLLQGVPIAPGEQTQTSCHFKDKKHHVTAKVTTSSALD